MVIDRLEINRTNNERSKAMSDFRQQSIELMLRACLSTGCKTSEEVFEKAATRLAETAPSDLTADVLCLVFFDCMRLGELTHEFFDFTNERRKSDVQQG